MSEQRKHPLGGLLVAQFFGAFNDNAWKLIVTFLAMRAIRAELGPSGPEVETASQVQTALALVTLTLPLMLFSLPAGTLADRVSKRSVFLAMKGVEVLLMAAGATVLWIDQSNQVLLLVVLGFMGVQSALFSPAKYGILPEILPHERLSKGNGALEMWTFVAIIAGMGAAGTLLDQVGPRVWLVGLLLTTFSLVGFVAAFWVPRVPRARAEGGVISTVRTAWATIRADRVLWLTIQGLTFYWAIASLLGGDVLVYAKTVLGLGDAQASYVMAAFGLGVGGGCVAAGLLSSGKVEYGLIPLGATGLSLFSLVLGLWDLQSYGTVGRMGVLIVLMALLGGSSGLIVVPLKALLQWKAPADRRGAVIALSNVFVFGGILVGSLAAPALAHWAKLPPQPIILAAALAVIVGTGWAIWLLPNALLRLLLLLLTKTFYRLNVVGRANVPQEGGALLVPNHVSFADGLFVVASLDRPVRFIVASTYFERPLLRPFLKSLGAIPVSATGGPRVVLRALRDAGRHLDDGDLVCIFAEGQMTRTGMLLPFRRGFERIVKGRTVPLIPMHLDRVWGSIFSRAGGRFITKIPERVPYPVTVSFGAAMPTGTRVPEVRQAVQGLGEAAWALRKADRGPLHHSFIRSVRRYPLHMAFAQADRPPVSRFKALTGAIALARILRGHWQGQQHVGILLPPSTAGGLVNIAASLAGRTSVNLNYTAGRAGMTSAAKQAGLRTVVTSRTFVEKAGLEVPDGVEPLWIEDIAAWIGIGRKLAAFVLAFVPPRPLERACGAQREVTADDVATVIFSSGSTGEPKGVQLTHFNVDSNVEAVSQVFRVGPADRMLGILPLFHSFGFMALWCSANYHMGIAFHPNPLDAVVIGELVQRYRLTILLATPTFLQLYMRRCAPGQFGSLRLVVAGAEKLSPKLAEAFEDRFGIRPMEGYGTTECAPVVAANAPAFRAPGFYQVGARRGTVGQPLPGVTVHIVDPDTFEPLPPDTPGMLLVKGPNVMQGYLGRDDLTAKVMRDGWYVTGDIALMDEDGFVKITDRLSRFSKIGGEMVPHGRVEEALHEAAEEETQVFAVAAVADERKGERLAVLHTLNEDRIPAIVEKLAASGLPNLFIPQANQFVKVDALPLLGTGKLDLRAIKRIVDDALAPPAAT